jgi:hypothetical protein
MRGTKDMLELFDVNGNYQGRIVRSPIIYPGMESVSNWGFIHASAGGKLGRLNRTAGNYEDLVQLAGEILSKDSN